MSINCRPAFAIALLSIALSACAHQGQPKVPSGPQGAPLAWTYSYDQLGQVSAVVDPGGRKTTIDYGFFDGKSENPVQRLTRRTEGGEEVAYTFDPLGRRIAMRDRIGETTYAYDGFGRLARVARTGADAITYGYDFEGRLTSVGVGTGNDVSYRYDYLGRLNEVTTPVGPITFDYRPSQRQVVRRFPNGITTTWTFRPSGELESLVHRDAKQTVLAGYAYSYRPDGRIESIDETTSAAKPRHVTFEYDPDHRLVRASDAQAHDFRYQYDSLGNRTTASAKGAEDVKATYDWAGRMLDLAGKPAEFDASGNLSRYSGFHGTRTFEHNPQNRLAAVRTGTVDVHYEYDGDGLLLRRTSGTAVSAFVTDPSSRIWKPLLTRSEAAKQTLYVWLGERLLADVTDGHARFYLEDHLGTARNTVDGATGTVLALETDPYGSPLQALSEAELRVGFGGLFLDTSAAVYLTAARTYDPQLGRFLEPDPVLQLPGATSPMPIYAYCSGDPLNWFDRDGRAAKPVSEQTVWEFFNPFYGTEEVVKGWDDLARERGIPQYSWLGHSLPAARDLAATYLGAKAAGAVFSGVQKLIGGAGRTIEAAKRSTTVTTRLGEDSIHPVQRYINALDSAQRQAAAGDIVTTFPLSGGGTYTTSVSSRMVAGILLGLGALGVASDIHELRAPFREDMQRATRRPDLQDPSGDDDAEHSRGCGPLGCGPCPGGSCGDDGGPGGGGFAPGPGTPQDIGGVSLAAAPDALAYLGDIEGVVLDEKNDRIVLVSSAKGSVALAPLRLDDVVAIFRSVYATKSGGPYVSIDPDPTDPRNQKLRIDPEIQDTHVGWVLFEADRVMKGYAAGKDNVSGSALRSRVAGYRSLPEILLGSATGSGGGSRFWITPAEVRIEQSAGGTASLIAAPMRVATEKMLTSNGRLQSQPGVSTPESETFAKWFTDNYSRIERDYSATPPGSGKPAPEQVFAEVRRLTAISAVAYSLLVQGKPLPRWMREWSIAKVPLPRTTPTVQAEVRRPTQGGTHIVRVTGGACTIGKSATDPNCPVPVIDPNSARATALRSAVVAALQDPAPFATSEFTTPSDGRKHRAVALPGWKTKDLGANALASTDLRPRVGTGSGLVLARFAQSFSKGGGEVGPSWQLNAPVLVTEPRGVPAPTGGIQGYCEQEWVEWSLDRNRIGLSPRQRGGAPAHLEGATISFLPAEGDCTAGSVEVVDRGERVYADDNGLLLALQAGEHMRVYRWTRSGSDRLLSRMEEWRRDQILAKLDLSYTKGRLATATGCWGGDVRSSQCAERRTVTYEYDARGFLVRVSGDGTDTRYAYRDEQVTRIESRQGGMVLSRDYAYDRSGRLTRERVNGGPWVAHRVTHSSQGMTMTSHVGSGSGRVATSVRYDADLRIAARTYPDGAREVWDYANGSTRTSTLVDGSIYRATWDSDGQLRDFRGPSGPPLLAVAWEGGVPTSIRTPSSEYAVAPGGAHGISGYVVTAPGRVDESLQVQLDETARTYLLRGAGSEYRANVATDKSTQQFEWGEVGAQPAQVKVIRDQSGSIDTTTSWGDRAVIAMRGGQLQSMILTRAGRTAQVSFENGRPTRFVDFDRGEATYRYDGTGLLVQASSPGGLVTSFTRGPSDLTETMSVGGKYALTAKYDATGRLVSLVQSPLPQ